MADTKTIDVKLLYGATAKLDDLSSYVEKATELAGEGNEVVLTGQGPIWLYLKVAHALHGKVIKLVYRSPALKKGEAQMDVVIFDHDPF
jgi:CRISPR-associated protein Csx3